MANGAAATQVRWWVPGDWNGFFGLFTNVVLNVIVLTGLCLGVVQLPADTVFGRILPALGIALAIVLISWTANIRLPFGLPGGLVAVIVGIVVGWVAYFAGWSDVVKAEQVRASFGQFGLHLPMIGTEVWRGLADVAPLLVTA